MNQVKIAVLGFGRMGQRHANLVFNHPKTRLSSIIDPKIKEGDFPVYPETDIFKDLDSFIINSIQTDLVIIATPNGLHAEHAEICLKAGMHVLLEKPIALYAQDVVSLYQLGRQVNKHIFVGWQIRQSPNIIALKKWLDKEIFGKVGQVEINCLWSRGAEYYRDHLWHGSKELDGGPLYTQFSHVINLLAWIFGDLDLLDASLEKKNPDFEHTGELVLTSPKAPRIVMKYSISMPEGTFSNSMLLKGETGCIQMEGKYFENVTINTMECSEVGPQTSINDMASYCSREQLDSVIDQLDTAPSQDELHLELNTTSLIERVYK